MGIFPAPYMIYCKDVASQVGRPVYESPAGQAFDEIFASWSDCFDGAETVGYLTIIMFLENRGVE